MKGIVWGSTFERAREKLNEIRKDYARIGEKEMMVREGAGHFEITYECGDHWRAVSARESARGCRTNLSLVDKTINKDFVDTVIKHSTSAFPWATIAYF